MIGMRCTECGLVVYGDDEYEAEVKFDNHQCPQSDKFKDMSEAELLKYILHGDIIKAAKHRGG